MQRFCLSRGFTVVEILIVIAILGVIATGSLIGFRNMHLDSARRIAAMEIAEAFREARNNTLGAMNDTVYGVRVGTSSVTHFTGSAYSAGDSTNKVYVFEGGVTAAGTLVTNGTDIVFERLTGAPSASGTIEVSNRDGTHSTSVIIQGTGLVEY